MGEIARYPRLGGTAGLVNICRRHCRTGVPYKQRKFKLERL